MRAPRGIVSVIVSLFDEAGGSPGGSYVELRQRGGGVSATCVSNKKALTSLAAVSALDGYSLCLGFSAINRDS